MPRVCVVLADGFEEIEAVTVIDVLRRAGIDVVTLGVRATDVVGSHGVAVRADRRLGDAANEAWDMVILPGGMPGATTLRDDPAVQGLIRAQKAGKRPLAAICAAPIALGKAGVLQGLRATSYPGFEKELSGATYCEDRVVADGDVITSRGPGTALEFSFEIVRRLRGARAADDLQRGMLVRA